MFCLKILRILPGGESIGHVAVPLKSGLLHRLYATTPRAAISDTDVIFRQLLDYRTFTYTYLLADAASKKAVLIDPVYEQVNRDVKLVKELGLDLIYGMNTHMHADHITGTGELRKHLPTCRSLIGRASGAKADVYVDDGDFVKFGKFALQCRSTPGHTNGCFTFVWHEKSMAFTGDALLIRGCGRTDFQQGDSRLLYHNVHNKILSLADHFLLYPAHDYVGRMVTTVGEEKLHNPRLTKTVDEFITIMAQLNLPYPRFIDEALPANLVCGVFEKKEDEKKEDVKHADT